MAAMRPPDTATAAACSPAGRTARCARKTSSYSLTDVSPPCESRWWSVVIGCDGPAEPFQQRPRFADALADVGLDIGQRVGLADARRGQLLLRQQVASGHGDHRYPGGAGGGGDPGRRLAVQRLLVQRALPGDDEVGTGQMRGETGELQ